MYKWRRKNTRLLLVFGMSMLLLLSYEIIEPTPILADILVYYYSENGITLHNGTNILMPEANVEIVFTHNHSDNSLHVFGEYQIYTNTTQNTTLAFVYPLTWSLWSNEEFDSSTMNISQNGTLVDYSIYNWTELSWNLSDYTPIMSEEDWLLDASFAIFNLELIANTTLTIIVDFYGEFFGNPQRLTISYFVASAKTFGSDTHQTVNFTIIEETAITGPDPKITHFPKIDAIRYTNGNITNIFWEFMISEFAYDEVAVGLSLSYKPTFTVSPTSGIPSSTTNPLPYIIGPVLFSVTFGVFAIACIFVLSKLRS